MQNYPCSPNKVKKQGVVGLITKPYRSLAVYMCTLSMIVALGASVFFNHVHAKSVADFEISAVYIYRFSQFITWPRDNSALTYCTLGTDNIALTLSRLLENNKKRIVTLSHINQMEQCEILYISQQKSKELNHIPVKNGVLTIGSGQAFLKKGGMIELRSVEQRVRPVIALSASKKADLSISSKLLKISILASKQQKEGGQP